MEKEIRIAREFSFLPDPDHEGRTKEIRHYRNEKLVARYGSVYDENGNVIGVRQLRVEDVAPLSLMEKVRKSIWKKPEKLDYLNWIGIINCIGTINTINKVKTIEEILNIKKVEEITEIKDIKTIGADNIFIDLLKKGAYIEDRRTLENKGETVGWGLNPTGNNRSGKFFPRGCMGFIYAIDVYVRDAGSSGGTITLYISPQQGMGYILSKTSTVGAGSEGWNRITFNRKWNYDSMFIWFIMSSSDLQVGYDIDPDPDPKHDDYSSTDSGATWTHNDHRAWIKAHMKGQSIVILSVGGIVNTIEIPHATSKYEEENVELPAGTETEIAKVIGAGFCDYIVLHVGLYTGSHGVIWRVYCDGVESWKNTPSTLNLWGVTASTPKVSLTKYTENELCTILLSKIFEFQRELRVTAESTNVLNVNCYLSPNLVK